jgi:hypothetical protein
MKKRQLTPEQIAARDARRARVKDLCKQIKAMSPEQRQALAMQHQIVTIEDRGLSPYNQCLIMMQKPDATIVGGFRQWLRDGRCVMKGESGLSIWIPRFPKAAGDGDEPIADADDVRFIAGVVFDVSQTVALEEQPQVTDEPQLELAIA